MTITVKKKLLATRSWEEIDTINGDRTKSKEILPEIGDPVDFHVKGSVSAVDGDNVTVIIKFIDGKRAEGGGEPEKKAKSADEEHADEEAALLEELKQEDGGE